MSPRYPHLLPTTPSPSMDKECVVHAWSESPGHRVERSPTRGLDPSGPSADDGAPGRGPSPDHSGGGPRRTKPGDCPRLGIDPDTVCKWRGRWARAQEQLAGAEAGESALSQALVERLLDAPRSGRPGVHPRADRPDPRPRLRRSAGERRLGSPDQSLDPAGDRLRGGETEGRIPYFGPHGRAFFKIRPILSRIEVAIGRTQRLPTPNSFATR